MKVVCLDLLFQGWPFMAPKNNHCSLLPYSSIIFVIFFSISLCLHPCSCSDTANYTACAPFTCGTVRNIGFPFSSSNSPAFCGLPGYRILCEQNNSQATAPFLGLFQLKTLSLNDRLAVVSDLALFPKLVSGNCEGLENFSFSYTNLAPFPLSLPSWTTYLNLYRCPRAVEASLPRDFFAGVENYTGCKGSYTIYIARNVSDARALEIPRVPSNCAYIKLPVLSTSLINPNVSDPSASFKSLNSSAFMDVVEKGFWIQWPSIPECESCSRNGGRCGFQDDPAKVDCFYPENSGGQASNSSNRSKSQKRRIIIGVTTTTTFIVLVIIPLLIFKFKYRGRSSIFFKDYFQSKRSKEIDQNMQEFIRSYQSMLVTKYSYTSLHKMSDGFKFKLGGGGYGNVYKGTLSNGRLVAIKILEKLQDGQDFVNEVATIGTIHHVNVINLLGFCWEGSKRALVYEFMTNGSLGDLISKGDLINFLGWPKLLEIALGIAFGIEYLHQGCDSQILHLDIKPQNVLLDENYNPKISDFGLAKSFSRNQSEVSLTNAKGTIGYIAPEIFLRNFGGVSHKSDVYSYGMLLLEMVGGRKNTEIKMEPSSTASYFANRIYSQLNLEISTEIAGSIETEDSTIAKKLMMVGLWCVQMSPANRPSMSRVVEMLRGSCESIEMPPKPYLFSQPKSRHESSVESGVHDFPLMFDSI